MEQQIQTIGSVVRAMLKYFTPIYTDDAQISWELSDVPDWVSQIIQACWPNQPINTEISNILFHIFLEIYIAENYEEAVEFVMQIEPEEDIEKLTAWLHKNPKNLQYLSNVLANNPVADGVKLLSQAYQDFIMEIGLRLTSAIEDFIQTEVEKPLSS
jgi:hypothetical protein